jgi:cell division protein FtsQ
MKKFWRILKKILTIILVLSFVALFVVVLTSAIQKQNKLQCQSLTIKIDYDSGLAFLNEQEIKDKLNYLSGGSLIGKTISEVDFHTLEQETEKNPFVENAEVYVNQQQGVVVEIIQKRPILRVINNDGVSYYIGEKNERIPLNNTFTPHVAVALGKVETHKDTKRDSIVQAALYNLIQFVRKDDFLNALVDQVYVNENDEVDIVPVSGMHIIRFGKADEQVEEKFKRLKIFYKEGLKKVGWNKYKTINLKYENQVVCEKKDTTNTL